MPLVYGHSITGFIGKSNNHYCQEVIHSRFRVLSMNFILETGIPFLLRYIQFVLLLD